MKILFDQMNDTVLEKFNGGEGRLVAKMYNDGKTKILRGLLAPGCSIGMHTHETNSEIMHVLAGTARVIMDGETEIIRAGQTHYCPKGHTHTTICDGPEELHILAVVPEQ